MFEAADLGFSGHQFQTLGNAAMRVVVKMTVVPAVETPGVTPVGDEPDFLRPVEWAENFHAFETGLPVHQMRPLAECRLHLGGLVVGNDEFAERHKGAGESGAEGGGLRRGGDRSDCMKKRTTTGDGRGGFDWKGNGFR